MLEDTELGKAIDTDVVPSSVTIPTEQHISSRWGFWISRLTQGFENRGIERVLPHERQDTSKRGDLQMVLLWFSANVSINNLAVAICGPVIYNLGFLDSALCVTFGTVIGALTTSYMCTWGAESGNRTMIVIRFFMGYYPAKLCSLLNIILMLGYCTIDCIIGGQVLSAVTSGSMTITVGIVIVAFCVCLLSVFGIKWFLLYERFAWIPQLIALCVLLVGASSKFDTSLQSTGSASTILANRLSFFCLILYVPNSWAGAGSDFYVYYPESTPKWKIFWLSFTGLTLSFVSVNMIGVGLGSGTVVNATWSDAYQTSSGALITAGYAPLHDFGKFCAVVVALGVVANNVPGTYTAALGCQTLGRYTRAVPRWIWCVILVMVQLIFGLAGRNQLSIIFTNFLALMGYWLMIMVAIVLEEHLLFRLGLTFDWSAWEDKAKLPVGVAALISFLVGWVGAVLGMSQVWFVGPIAEKANHADVGVWLGCGFACICFPPLRYLELKVIGR